MLLMFAVVFNVFVTFGAATTSAAVEAHVDNPYVGATQYINPDYAALINTSIAQVTDPVLKAKMETVKSYPTAIWLDRIAAIQGGAANGGRLSLEQTMDNVLAAKQGSTPIVVQFVIYDLPGRDCKALASNGELPLTAAGLATYKTQYIDAIASVLSKSKYEGIRIVTIIEPDSLPNLVTNLSDANCAAANSSGIYVDATRYALDKLHAIPNVYTYMDLGHSGWLGWDSNRGPAIDLITTVVNGTVAGKASVDGFITNTANTTPLVEPNLPNPDLQVGGSPLRSASYYEWNPYFDEADFTAALYTGFVAKGWPASIGFLVDTSRNGWGGPNRPSVASGSTVSDYADSGRIDRRYHRGNWCNPAGAGMGEAPTVAPAAYASSHIDALVWVKPPGESDGSSSLIPNDEGKGFDRMCDPTYISANGKPTGALANAPVSGHWFHSQFVELVTNAYPAIPQTVVAAAPSAPASLTAVAGNAQTTLSWAASSGATSYNVKRSTTSGGPYTTVATGVTGTTYTNTGLTNGTTYYYVVSAVNSYGESANSAQASATPSATSTVTVPAAPTGLTASAGDSQVTLSWTASTGATSYNVKRSTTSGGPYTTLATGVTATSYVNASLTNGTTYYYVVSAVNSAGESANSAQVSATPSASATPETHVDNPYVGATQYVNPDYAALVDTSIAQVTDPVLKAKMEKIKTYPTAIWLDRIAAIQGGAANGGRLSLEQTMDNVLAAKQGNTPITVQFIIYDLPGRDCKALASNGELPLTAAGLATYKTQYIDAIASVLSKSKYAGIRVVTIIEPDSLPNLVTNLSDANCAAANSSGIYVDATRYALDKLHAIPNVYTYMDLGHSGWLGWDSNRGPAIDLITTVVNGTIAGKASVDGFITNTANTTPLVEPNLPNPDLQVGGSPLRSASYYEWNPYFDEADFTAALYSGFVAKGWPTTIGFLVDTSRNGWGGPNRPTIASGSTVNDYADSGRIDRRYHRGNWCNPAGAGMGEAPTVAPAAYASSHIDALVWAKPPGESDGSSSLIPNDEGKGFDRMCDPTYIAASGKPTGALANAPVSGHWFHTQFVELVTNAYPAIPYSTTVTTPAAPASLTATAGNAQVVLSWAASTGATSYNVKRATTSGGTYTTVATGVTGTSYTNTGLTNGTTYYYVVSAVNSAGESSNSSQASATPAAPAAVPAAPTGLTATAGNAQVVLSWTASTGATSYNVKRATTSGGAYTTVATGVTGTTYTNTGLTNGTTYYYVVSAVNSAGESSNSSQVSATPVAPATVPAAPTGLTATAGNAQVVLSWTASTGATSYNVKRATTSGGPYTTVATGVTGTTYTNTGLTNGTTYYYVVSAVNSVGESSNSTQASATPVAPVAVPAAPTGLTATAGNAQVVLAWTASTGATSYNVKRATTSGGPYTTVATGVTGTTYTNTGLTNGTTYYYVVSAVNSAGESSNSAQTSATPVAPVTVPAAPTGLTATAGNAQVVLAWTASTGATSYNVKRSTTSGGTFTTIATGVTGTTYTDTGLTNGTTYYYVVSAVNSAGESANSSVASATPVGSTTTSSLVVQYKLSNANANDNQIYATFNIKNTGTTAVSLSNLKLRYYLTKDTTSASLNYWVDYAQVGTSAVSGVFGTISPAKTTADTYLELSFSSAAGSIAAGGQTGDIQVRIAKSDWTNFSESNDYSFDGTKSSFADWNKVTLYNSGSLVWGIEP
nr:glycoside hydrolase family 6 protein [Paenibacillus terricola]